MKLIDIYTDIENLRNLPNTDVEIINYTDLGNPIYLVHIGPYDKPQLIIEGAIHAREYVTAIVLIKQIVYLHDKDLDFGIYYVPLANPDGVMLVLEGVNDLPPEKQEFLLNVNNQNPDFSLWKANANAVDLNVNFDALWGQGAQNVTYPSPANFIGYYPNSEVEVNTLIELTKKVNPVLTLSYHTRGNIIFYGFEVLTEEEIKRDRFIADKIYEQTGYLPIQTYNSTGAYPDWVSLNYHIPAFTIEVGDDTLPHPIGMEYAEEIFEINKNVPIIAYEALKTYNNENS